MKKLLFIALLCAAASSFAQIRDIRFPEFICPANNPKFTVEYNFYSNPYGSYPTETVRWVAWEIRQNGSIIKSLPSYSFDYKTLPWETGRATVEVGSLPLGNLTVNVTIGTSYYTGSGFPSPRQYTRTESFLVGIPTPEGITGPLNVCPGQTATYSTDAKLFGATAFTWNVPAGWYINGIPGPVVTGLGSTVSITNNGTEINTYKIGVKGTSETCGTSREYTKMVTVGYSYDIDAKNVGGGVINIVVQGPGAASYTWTFTSGWTVVSNSGKTVEVNPNGIAGFAKVTVVDPCGKSHDYFYYYTPGACNATMSLYPTAVVDYMYFDPGTATITSIKIASLNGISYTLPYTIVNGIYHFDTLSLPYGTYIFSTKDTSGCLSQMRFSRVEY